MERILGSGRRRPPGSKASAARGWTNGCACRPPSRGTRCNTQLRLQYNYDLIGGSQSEHSVWLGFGFNWGGREVR
ncbi:MAG: hypothetical protein R3F11_21775 [Verrucomicrobiales bacterium]